ncbi:MAG TPA: transglutaminase-like cysteine peptidase [Sphingomicrobium sp.]|nr:transglutaminase-like cysteine peptidase [Sphingomicrobium sp.]
MTSTQTGISPRAARCAALLAALALAAIGAVPAHAEPNPITVTGKLQPQAPNLFGTVALPANLSRYSDGWYRSRIDASRHPALQQLIAPARILGRVDQVAFVQRAVTSRIRWMSDATEWGAHDYWASAGQTLDRGAGDMEDRAIVKLQALKALGVPSRDLYLTMGRDKVGGQIVVLIVRVGGQFLVLDDTGGTPYAAERRPEFQPMLTLGANRSWIHGKRVVVASRGGVASGKAK